MNKKYIFSALAIVVLLGAVAFFGKNYFQKKPIDRMKEVAACKSNFNINDALVKLGSLSDGAQYSAAAYFSCQRILNADVSACDKLPAGNFKDECKNSFGGDFAIILNNAVQKKSFTDEDVNNCADKVAFNGMDANTKEDYCRQALTAAVNNAASFCNQAKSDREKARCLNFISADPSEEKCNGITDKFSKEGCVELADFSKILRTGKEAKDCSDLYGSQMLDLFSACAINFSHSCNDQLQNFAETYCNATVL